MEKYFSWSLLLLLIAGCQQQSDVKHAPAAVSTPITTRMYASAVADSFSIFIQLPEGYDAREKKSYPVVYLLDANLYFDIMAVTIRKYAEVGLAPDVILVGIGYKDFPTMDSLRNRDDTYPVAIPEYEMSVSGGAGKFLSFIQQELSPYIDKQYSTDTTKRILMGHSLGGYFTLYALQQELGGAHTFNGYIAASPSLHYNHYYLLQQLKKVTAPDKRNKQVKAYVSYGGLENSDDSAAVPLTALLTQLSAALTEKSVRCKGDVYSALDHMDTQLPGFIKGLQWTLADEGAGR